MAATIRIKRSSVAGNPTTLAAGELAYSAYSGAGGNRLYVGMGSETNGNAANHYVIGGTYYTGLIDASTAGTLTTNASSIPVLSATGTIDKWLVGNLQLTGNTLSSTDTNGNISITPNGTGKVILTNTYIGDSSTSLAEYIYDTVGGAVTGGTGITVTNSDAGNTSTISITSTGVTAASYGSATAVPVLTINAQGQITSATTATISTSFSIAGDTGTDTFSNGGTLTFTGGTGITSAVTNDTVTFDIDSTVATLDGTQTLTGKTISGASNTLTNIGNSSLTNSSVTINGTSVSLGGSATVTAAAGTLTGTTLNSTVVTSSLTSVGTIASGTWNGTTIAVGYGGTGTTNGSITGTGALTFTAGGSNTNVNLVPQGTGTVDVASKRITNLADPTGAQDAATKAYVDAMQTGLDVKGSVRAATTANITLSNTQTVDNVALSVGDRVLVKNQSTASENGIYVVASGSWSRAADADNNPGSEVTSGMFTFVEQGDTNADSGWVLTTDGTITLGSTSLTFVQFSGAGQITAGSGLTKTGNTLDVQVDNSTLAIVADTLQIKSTYAGQNTITTLGTVSTGTWNGTVIGATYGGTGVNNGSSTITLGGSLTLSGAYSTTLTVTGATTLTLPTTGTLATLAGTEALSNKTITASSFSGTTITGSGLASFTNSTDASSTTAAAVVLTGGLAVGKKIYVGDDIIGAGADTSTLDGFNIDGGTYS